MNKEFPADDRTFIHIYGDLSYAREAGTASRLVFFSLFYFLFFGVLPPSAVPPHRILFPLVGRSMRREFGDHKYRNGHGFAVKKMRTERTARLKGRRSASSGDYRTESR